MSCPSSNAARSQLEEWKSTLKNLSGPTQSIVVNGKGLDLSKIVAVAR